LRYIKTLSKPVIIVGDLNISHTELDVHDFPSYKKYSEVHADELKSYNHFLKETKLIDSFRHLHPSLVRFSYWTQKYRMRDTNRGWRSDFGLVDPKFFEEKGVDGIKMIESDVLDDVYGSDHCPIKLQFEIT